MKISKGCIVRCQDFSFELSDVKLLCRIQDWVNEFNTANSKDAFCMPVYTFGDTDLSLLNFHTDSKTMAKIDGGNHANELPRGLVERVSHVGLLEYNSFESPQELYRSSEAVLIGIVHYKLHPDLRRSLYSHYGRHDKLVKAIRESFFLKVHKIRELENVWLEISLELSYGVGDFQIVVYSNSFEAIKHYVSLIRAIELKEIISIAGDETRHICISTDTVMGFIWKYGCLQNAISTLDVCSQENARVVESVCGATSVLIRPGHIKRVIEDSLTKGADGAAPLPYSCSPVIGRNDLIYERLPQSLPDSLGFIKEHLRLVDLFTKNHEVLTTETSLSFPRLAGKINHGGGKVSNTNGYTPPYLKALKDQQDAVKNAEHLHVFVKEALVALLQRLIVLGSDRYLADYFQTLASVVERGVGCILESSSLKKPDPQLNYWLAAVACAYNSLFSGSPPIGASASPELLRLAYSQKINLVFDGLAKRLITKIEKELGSERCKNIAVATSTQHCFIAATLPAKVIQNAIVLLPAKSIYHSEVALITFFHEIGHVLFDCISDSNYYLDRWRKLKEGSSDATIDPRERKNLGEAVAEFVPCLCLFDGDLKRSVRAVNQIIEEIYNTNNEMGLAASSEYFNIKKRQIKLLLLLLDEEYQSDEPLFIFFREIISEIDKIFGKKQTWLEQEEADLLAKVFQKGFFSTEYWELWRIFSIHDVAKGDSNDGQCG